MSVVLTLLRIRNLALVEELEWQIEPGFVAVTGETGAGKSIIIGALQLLLGERADKSLIRTGADLCTVEGVFSGADQGIEAVAAAQRNELFNSLDAGVDAAAVQVIRNFRDLPLLRGGAHILWRLRGTHEGQ